MYIIVYLYIIILYTYSKCKLGGCLGTFPGFLGIARLRRRVGQPWGWFTGEPCWIKGCLPLWGQLDTWEMKLNWCVICLMIFYRKILDVLLRLEINRAVIEVIHCKVDIARYLWNVFCPYCCLKIEDQHLKFGSAFQYVSPFCNASGLWRWRGTSILRLIFEDSTVYYLTGRRYASSRSNSGTWWNITLCSNIIPECGDLYGLNPMNTVS